MTEDLLRDGEAYTVDMALEVILEKQPFVL